MSSKERWLTLAMAVVIALVLGARPILVALDVLVPYEVEIAKAPDPVVLTTPLYGAEKVLQQLGYETGRWDATTTRLEAGQTLILPGNELALSLHQVDALIESVRGGAHLVVLAPWSAVGLSENPNLPIARLLSAFGVSVVSSSSFVDQNEDQAPTASVEPATPETARAELRVLQGGARCPTQEQLPLETPNPTLHPPLVPSSVRFEMSWGRTELQTSAPPDCWVGLPQANGTTLYQLVQTAAGAGRVTVLADARAFDNVFLTVMGRAHLLAGLARQPGFEGRVWFPTRFSRASLATVSAPLGWPFVIAIVGALIAWIWASATRFGPVLASESSSRRRLAEHLEATGRWAWRQHLHDELIAHTRRVALDRVFFAHPRWRSLTTSQLQSELAEATELPLKTIEEGFYGSVRPDATRFVAAITLWERIRKQR
jgi:hypothetical protein